MLWKSMRGRVLPGLWRGPGAAADPRLGELAQPRVRRVVRAQQAPPRRCRRSTGAFAAGEDDLLARGGDLRIERAAHLALEGPQRRGRPAGVVEEDHVPELERVQDLVRAEA